MGVSGSELWRDGMRIAFADFRVLDVSCIDMQKWLGEVRSVLTHVSLEINTTTYLKDTRERILDLVICIVYRITNYNDEASIPHYISMLHKGIQLDKNIVFKIRNASRTGAVSGP